MATQNIPCVHSEHEEGQSLLDSYGIIGNMHSCALVSINSASIDWYCYPYFDSPSIFGSMLDKEIGGRFSIRPTTCDHRSKQFYWPDTNVLITRFLSEEGVTQVIDYMPVKQQGSPGYLWLVRRVKVVRGQAELVMECSPAFDYARRGHHAKIEEYGAVFTERVKTDDPSRTEGLVMHLETDLPLQLGRYKNDEQGCKISRDTVGDDGVHSRFTLKEGETAVFVFRERHGKHRRYDPEAHNTLDAKSKLWSELHTPEGHTDDYSHKTDCTALEDRLFNETLSYWKGWLGKFNYKGRWREIMQRSALVLKLLTFAPTGAIISSPTCGLPLVLEKQYNYDPRYTWIKDAAFTLYAFLRVGFTEEAAQFMGWLECRCKESKLLAEMEDEVADDPVDDPSLGGALRTLKDGVVDATSKVLHVAEEAIGKLGSADIPSPHPISALYTIHGKPSNETIELGHLSGYQNSRPVKIGTSGSLEYHLDIYGELLDSVYLYNKYGTMVSYDFWTFLRRLVDWVCHHWHETDDGVWGMGEGRKHYVYSKVMCWVAVDRGLRLADRRSFPAPRRRWYRVRDEIYESIMRRGWSPERKAFVQAYDTTVLDASVLIMPLTFFISPTDPRMLSTLDAIWRPPQKGGLVYSSLAFRYQHEAPEAGQPASSCRGRRSCSTSSIDEGEGTCNICSFWLIEALTRASAKRPDLLRSSRIMFEELLGFANHVGLYGGETGLSGETLGNFPQALTHLSLISCAFNLDRTLGSKGL
eukprot:TRINITY_DN4755_c0_g1_i2.p1 TRINITY_DN4755_c0_g1~~TRINITY_DN4755_c0_g1_i2.p1  ORF type:complete len:754 (-),score=85.78 TRINITY_DN4755_c0_g1_i2:50-2311(-)